MTTCTPNGRDAFIENGWIGAFQTGISFDQGSINPHVQDVTLVNYELHGIIMYHVVRTLRDWNNIVFYGQDDELFPPYPFCTPSGEVPAPYTGLVDSCLPSDVIYPDIYGVATNITYDNVGDAECHLWRGDPNDRGQELEDNFDEDCEIKPGPVVSP